MMIEEKISFGAALSNLPCLQQNQQISKSPLSLDGAGADLLNAASSRSAALRLLHALRLVKLIVFQGALHKLHVVTA